MKINTISFKNNIYNKTDSSTNYNQVMTVPSENVANLTQKNKSDRKNKILKYSGYAVGIIGVIVALSVIFKGKHLLKVKSDYKSEPKKPQKIIEKVSNNSEKIESETQNQPGAIKEAVNIENKPKEKPLFEIYNNGHDKYYRSYDEKNANKRLFVSKIYELAGIKVPEEASFPNYSTYKPESFQNRYIENLQKIPEKSDFYKKIQSDFFVDALVSNKDVLDSCRIDKNNNIYHIKFNNTLCTKQDGKPEHFGMVVEELSSFFNPKINPENAKLYSSMTGEDLITSLKRVAKIDKDELENISALSEYSIGLNDIKYKEIMRKRIIFLKEASNIAQKTPQEDLSIAEYTERIKNLTIERCIEKINKYSSINDLKYSVEHLDNKSLKEKYSEKRNERIKELTSNPKVLSENQTGEILKDYAYKKFEVTPEINKKIEELFGKEGAINYIRAISMPINDSQIKAFCKIANINDGKYREFCTKYPDRMVAYLNNKTLEDDQIVNFGENEWNIIMKSYTSIFDNPNRIEYFNALTNYKGLSGYDQINGILRTNYSIDKIMSSISNNGKIGNIHIFKNNINNIQSITEKFCLYENKGNFLDAAELNSDRIKIHLDKILKKTNKSKTITPNILLEIKAELKALKETLNKISSETGFMKKIDIMQKNYISAGEDEMKIALGRNSTSLDFSMFETLGDNLSKLMLNKNKIKEVLKYFNTRNPEIPYPSFLSTSISPYSTMYGNVKWILTLGKGTKYMYIEDLSNIFSQSYKNEKSEAELLVLPKHYIKIKKASYIDNKYYIVGEIIPSDKTVGEIKDIKDIKPEMPSVCQK